MKKKIIKSTTGQSKNKPIIVAVSGGFDPLHIGHVRKFKAAKKLGDKLIIILNNDNWLKKKKGYVFMPQEQRKEILEAIRWVDKVIFTEHKPGTADMSISKELFKLKPNIFAKGGDRNPKDVPIPGSEVEICAKIGCKIIYNVGEGGKVESSSWLLGRFLETAKRNRRLPKNLSKAKFPLRKAKI